MRLSSLLMRTMLRAMAALILLLSTGPVLRAVEPDLSPFLERSKELSSRGDSQGLQNLVGRERGNAYESVDKLLEGGDADSLTLAEALARAYESAHGDPRLLQRVTRFKQWTPEQRAARAEAMRIKNEGREAFDKGQLAKASSRFKQSLTIFRRIGDSREEGRCLSNLGAASVIQGDSVAAARWLEAAGATVARSGDLSLLIPIQISQAWSLEERGELAEARGMLESSLTTARLWNDREGEAVILTNLVSILEGQGDFEEGLRLAREQAEIGREISNAQVEAAGWNNQGAMHSRLGNPDAAVEEFRKGVEVCRRSGLAAMEADGEVNIAAHLRKREDFDGALRALGRARRAATSIDHPVVLSRIDLGEAQVLIEQARFQATLPLLQAAEARLKGLDDAGILPGILETRAIAFYHLGRFTEAVAEMRRAIALHEENARVGDVANAHYNLGLFRFWLGDTQAAMQELRTAARMCEQIGDRRGQVFHLNALGVVQLRAGNLAGARKSLEAASALAPQMTDRRTLAEILADLAEVELASGPQRRDAAQELLRRAFDLFDETNDALGLEHAATLMAEAFLSEGATAAAREVMQTARKRTAEQRPLEYEWKMLYLEGRVAEASGDAEEAARRYALSVAEVERMRGSVAPDLWRAAILEDRIAPYRALSRWHRRRGEAEEAYRIARLAKARTFVERLTPPALSEEFSVETPLPRELLPLKAAPVSKLQSRMGPGQILLDFFFDDAALVVFLTQRQRFSVVEIPGLQEGGSLEDLLDLLKHPGRPGPSQESVTRAWRAAARRAGSALMEPIREEIESKTHLLIAPNGLLHGVPFAALEVGGRPLVDRWSLSLVPAAETVLRDFPASSPGSTMVIFGNPASDVRGEQLPGAAEEARSVASHAGAGGALYLGRAASESVFREQAPLHRRIHLAAHGRINPLSPARSHILLAPDGSQDGKLEAGEIAALNLRADLVVLSGCETARESGLSRGSAEGDERAGLARAFLAAGAGSVIASLWEVEDREARRFMPELYPLLLGRTPSEALAELQRALAGGKIRGRDGRPLTHPFYWAGLVDYGAR